MLGPLLSTVSTGAMMRELRCLRGWRAEGSGEGYGWEEEKRKGGGG